MTAHPCARRPSRIPRQDEGRGAVSRPAAPHPAAAPGPAENTQKLREGGAEGRARTAAEANNDRPPQAGQAAGRQALDDARAQFLDRLIRTELGKNSLAARLAVLLVHRYVNEAEFAAGGGLIAWPSHRRMARDLSGADDRRGVRLGRLSEAIEALELAGLISVDRAGHAHRYHLHPVPIVPDTRINPTPELVPGTVHKIEAEVVPDTRNKFSRESAKSFRESGTDSLIKEESAAMVEIPSSIPDATGLRRGGARERAPADDGVIPGFDPGAEPVVPGSEADSVLESTRARAGEPETDDPWMTDDDDLAFSGPDDDPDPIAEAALALVALHAGQIDLTGAARLVSAFADGYGSEIPKAARRAVAEGARLRAFACQDRESWSRHLEILRQALCEMCASPARADRGAATYARHVRAAAEELRREQAAVADGGDDE